jgi:hypothetical protein
MIEYVLVMALKCTLIYYGECKLRHQINSQRWPYHISSADTR